VLLASSRTQQAFELQHSHPLNYCFKGLAWCLLDIFIFVAEDKAGGGGSWNTTKQKNNHNLEKNHCRVCSVFTAPSLLT